MSASWALPVLLAGGPLAGGVLSIAWERIPAWRAADLPDFRSAFAHTHFYESVLSGGSEREPWVSSNTRRNRDDTRAGSY
jgi:hypothetical protein